MPNGEAVGFSYNSLRIDSQWYWFLLFKDIRSVILVWMVWFLIPKNDAVLRLGASVFCVIITLVPINFILFYSAPFNVWSFILKVFLSLTIGYFLTYYYGIRRERSDSNNY